jgi:2',3'-cyclic-nucleotide 2'-phosphodiesterase (5'-nucleotidase family)
MKMKIWIMSAIALLAVAALYMGCNRAEARGKLQVMYSGNLRGSVAPCGCKVPKGGLARRAEFLSRHRNPEANWITLDAGNFVDRAGGTGGCTNKCQFTIFAYEDLHYDVLNIGRQEVWMGKQTLAAIMDTVRSTKFISANLLDRSTGKPFAEPYLIKEYGNMTVGILGLLNEADFPAGSSMVDTVNFKVGSYYEAVQKYVPLLAKKADVVVLLCELPSAALDTMLPKFPQINLVVSSGALRSGEQPTKVGNAQVVGTGSSGYSGSSCTLELNPAWPDSVGFASFTDMLTEAYDTPGVWADRLAAFNSQTGTPPPVSQTPQPSSTSMSNNPATSPTLTTQASGH